MKRIPRLRRKNDLSGVRKNRWYIVTTYFYVPGKLKALRLEFESEKEAKDWLYLPGRKADYSQFHIVTGKFLIESSIEFLSRLKDRKNYGYRLRFREFFYIKKKNH